MLNPPAAYDQQIGSLPPDCLVLDENFNGEFDFIQVFTAGRAELVSALPVLIPRLAENGALWVSYYKGTSKFKTDINRDSIWEIGRQHGLDAVRQIAVDDDWSAIRFKIKPG